MSSDPVVTDVSKLPVILKIAEVANIYRLSSRTVRRLLQANKFHPLPFDHSPYRWLRDDVARDLRTRGNGFAAKEKASTGHDAPVVTK